MTTEYRVIKFKELWLVLRLKGEGKKVQVSILDIFQDQKLANYKVSLARFILKVGNEKIKKYLEEEK